MPTPPDDPEFFEDAPAFEAYRDGRWVGTLSNASSDETRRRAALSEAEAALAVARQIPFKYLVTHLGVPVVEGPEAPKGGDNQRDAARRSVEELVAMAADLGIRGRSRLSKDGLIAAITEYRS